MKKIVLVIFTIIFAFHFLRGQNPNPKGDKSLLDLIKEEIEAGTIGERPLIYFNEEKISWENCRFLSQAIELKDLPEIEFVKKSKAIKKYGQTGKDGAVLITPFIDDLLTEKYYQGISNKFILQQIDVNIKKESIKKTPLLVIDGIPLRGEEIASKINNLKEAEIARIDVLNWKTGYQIFGIRAMNGVMLISTK